MRRFESFDDEINGVVTYEMRDGRWLTLDANAVREHGAATIIRERGYGHLLPTERVPVIWGGKRVGTVPPDFDPLNIKSQNFFYDPRPGDFVREDDAWIANRTLGPGDLESAPGFAWDRASIEAKR